MKFKKIDGFVIPENAVVKLYHTGNIKKVQYLQRRNNTAPIRKIDDNHVLNIITGEIIECKHIENRSENIAKVKESLTRLRDYINTNCVDVSRCRWVTLTYKENMTDTVRLYSDFKNFWKRFVYYCNQNNYGKPEYIIACEPQGRGAWHIHAIIIFDRKAPFIASDVLQGIWKQGFVKIKKIDNVDNVGAYLTAYMCDLQVEKYDNSCICNGIKTVEKNGHTKQYVKGARLSLYPPKFNIYRCSRGIKKPDTEFLSYSYAKEKVSSAKLTFSKSVLLSDDDTGFTTTVSTEYYNTARRK